MKLYLRPMSLLDALSVVGNANPYDIAEAYIFGYAGSHEGLAVQMQRSALSWTIADAEHMPVAVAGFDLLRQGVYRTWFLGVEDVFAGYGRELTAICARSIRNVLTDSARRVETVSLSNRTDTHRWYESIGLTRESESPCYGVNGESAVTYVRIR